MRPIEVIRSLWSGTLQLWLEWFLFIFLSLMLLGAGWLLVSCMKDEIAMWWRSLRNQVRLRVRAWLDIPCLSEEIRELRQEIKKHGQSVGSLKGRITKLEKK